MEALDTKVVRTHDKYTGKTVNIRKYSDKSFVVYGPDTEDMKEDLSELKGSYNPRLKHPLYPNERLKGWIFSNTRRPAVIDFFIIQDVDYKD